MTYVDPAIEPISLETLPSMPAAALRIVRLCDDPAVGLEDLAAAVTLDPVLAARILRMANSAAYNRGREITSLDVAMMMMGTKVVKITALGFSLSSIVSDQLSSSSTLGNQVWRQCLVKAVACRELAGLARLRTAPEAFLVGLFDGMGQMLAYLSKPAEYGALLAADPWPSPDAQRACLGFTVAELVLSALTSWGVPGLYVDVLRFAQEGIDPSDTPEVEHLAATLALGRHATRLLLGSLEADDANARRARAVLGLDQDAVDTIAVELGVHVKDLAATLDLDLGAQLDYQMVLNQARERLVETSLQMAEDSLRKAEQITSLEGQQEMLRRDAMTDRLTGLPNRASFDATLESATQPRPVRVARTGELSSGSLGIGMIDIDLFKVFNDTYGHRAGDAVLVAVGEALRSVTRRDKLIARYGGEEFVLVVHDLDGPETLHKIGERIRQTVENLCVEFEGVEMGVTVSLGAIYCAAHLVPFGGGELVEAADRLLYVAKRGGRNAVVVDCFG